MKKLLFIAMAAILSIGLIGGAFAYFTDTATTTANSFTAGTLSIDNNELTSITAFTIPNMAPGDVTGEYSVIIRNDGSINLGWLGDWQFSGSPALMDALYIDSAKMEFLSPSLANWLDDATPGYEADGADWFIKDGTGHGPYASWFTYVAGLSSFGVVTFNNFNNNAGMLPGSVYEHMGALKPGYAYRLTVKFGFAAGAGNSYQGLGPVTVAFNVNATQINSTALQAQGVPAASVPATVGFMNAQIADQTEP
jgi:predicted ribosomally synthesized peptide with SipW-like signal peptide